jgi:fucose permease
MPRTLEDETKTKQCSTSHISAKPQNIYIYIGSVCFLLSLHFEELRIPAQVAIKVSCEKYIRLELKGH